ncbi:protein-L-isoaspartate(D-aspartate) O-methyltransferase [Parvicella tangerina]|uniref:Protein-L-isoaspartate O-methyltransferase n=1 Tax=Parvicella tangerina TaxID=2829795 RepID=A0A916JLD7_9FLAO|nr:protein-L-isoaspartate(D-aspartate) O-methyltransferase [Parvicella tangerina]CAG5080123.1 Protein-L-isoaspartate O-methyltransferase [Parvicella tangerina]
MFQTEDTYKHQGMRKGLVNLLREKEVASEEVLSAIGKIPRHMFFDSVFHNNFAYEDLAFPIGAGQTISQPSTVAFQSTLLSIKKGDKILEIGTGSGYQTAVLLEMGAKVYSIERQRELFNTTKKVLQRLSYRANLYFGDGFEGKPTFAPFDKIIVTCGAPFIPPKLVEQLVVGGKMVIPVGEGKTQVMKLIEKLDNGDLNEESFGNFSFVPMLNDRQY